MNLTNPDKQINYFGHLDQTKCSFLSYQDQSKQDDIQDQVENHKSQVYLNSYQNNQSQLNKNSTNLQISQISQSQQAKENQEENLLSNLVLTSQSLFRNEIINASQLPDIFLLQNNKLLASIQQVIDMKKIFELERNELEQKIQEQRNIDELNVRKKLSEHQYNVNLINVQRSNHDEKINETQQLFKESYILCQKDNKEEIILKLINENSALNENFNYLLQEQKFKYNQLEGKMSCLIQSLELNHLQNESLKMKYLELKQNCRKKINKIKQSIVDLVEIREVFNQEFKRVYFLNRQILEQLQVFISQKKELEEMKRINKLNYNLIEQLRSSQSQLIEEKKQSIIILDKKEAVLQLLQYQTKDIEIQNQILLEQQKFNNQVQINSDLENKYCNQYIRSSETNRIESKDMKIEIKLKNKGSQKELYFEQNDCEIKSEYADENQEISKNDIYQIDQKLIKDQELVSEEPVNISIENKDQNQQENIYLEGESQIIEDDVNKGNFTQQQLSDFKIDQKVESQNWEADPNDQNGQKDKQIGTDENDQDIADIQFDDDFNDDIIQLKSGNEIGKVKFEVQTPLYNNLTDFDKDVQNMEENNQQQSGWDFECF